MISFRWKRSAFSVTPHLTYEALPWLQWYEASADPCLDEGLQQVYRCLEDRIAQRGAVCWASGRCCHFDSFGHDLYVTGLEVAWVLRQVEHGSGIEVQDWSARVTIDGPCPFQVNKLCSVRQIRPLGCRVFFCQEGTEQWQQEVYEQLLGELRALHDAHGLDYRYLEWRHALIGGLEWKEKWKGHT